MGGPWHGLVESSKVLHASFKRCAGMVLMQEQLHFGKHLNPYILRSMQANLPGLDNLGFTVLKDPLQGMSADAATSLSSTGVGE